MKFGLLRNVLHKILRPYQISVLAGLNTGENMKNASSLSDTYEFIAFTPKIYTNTSEPWWKFFFF